MNSFEDKTVLITGANGFLGSAIKKEMQDLKVRIVSAVWPPDTGFVYNSDTIAIDLRQADSYNKLNSFGHIDSIIHCAALLPGYASDLEILVANQEMTFNLLDWGRKNHISHFLFASTCRLYGMQSYPCIETSPLEPPDSYAVSKIACEFLIKTMLSESFIPYSIFRISAPYGPGSKANTVIRKFLENAAKGEPIILQGSGSRSQDFIYETDIALAFRLACQTHAEGVFNLSSGISVSMRSMAETVLSMFGHDIEDYLKYSGKDAQENYRGSFPIDAANLSFGYLPQTSIQDGLQKTAAAWKLI